VTETVVFKFTDSSLLQFTDYSLLHHTENSLSTLETALFEEVVRVRVLSHRGGRKKEHTACPHDLWSGRDSWNQGVPPYAVWLRVGTPSNEGCLRPLHPPWEGSGQ
jgi:hypothetical protein